VYTNVHVASPRLAQRAEPRSLLRLQFQKVKSKNKKPPSGGFLFLGFDEIPAAQNAVFFLEIFSKKGRFAPQVFPSSARM
jgi:hypothetical protein